MSGQSLRASPLERSEPIERARNHRRDQNRGCDGRGGAAGKSRGVSHQIEGRRYGQVRAVVSGSIERSQGKAKRVLDKRSRL